MKQIKVDLKPCPFCGSTPEYSVRCPECQCGTDGFSTNRVKGTDEENIKTNAAIWNKRIN